MTDERIHRCGAEGCPVSVSRTVFLCRKHYAALPHTLQVRLSRVYRGLIGGNDAACEEWPATRETVLEVLAERQIGPHLARECRSPMCNGLIVFLQTESGKHMPVNASTVEPTDQLFDRTRHVAHYTSCIDPDRFRR